MLDMSRLDIKSTISLSALIGVTSHLGYFIRGEHHLKAPRYNRIGVVTLFAIVGMQLSDLHLGLAVGLANTACISLSYLKALYTSMLLCRQFLHPPRHFTGPRQMG